jgi:flagellar basal body-associated protein FliL
MLYNVRVAVRVHFNNVERVQKFFERRASTVEDTISRVIRSADERHLNEPGMESLKRQIRYELSSLLGDDTLIEQVLIPACMPMPTGY